MSPTRRAVLSVAAGAAVALAGCSSAGDSTPTPDPEFRIGTLAFASDEPAGYDAYDPQPDATYERGATVWFYVGVRNGTPEDGVVEFETVFEVTPPEGEPDRGEDRVTVDVSGDVDHRRMFVTNGYYTTPQFPAGTYDLAVEVTDVHSETTDEATGEFVLE